LLDRVLANQCKDNEPEKQNTERGITFSIIKERGNIQKSKQGLFHLRKEKSIDRSIYSSLHDNIENPNAH
jgi:hypothetical protein